jgi:hypothetical protein
LTFAATFWETFFLFLIFLPLALIWGFALLDIFRRDDMGGLSKVLWILVIFLVPFFGTLIYLITRPPGATKEERVAIDEANRDFVTHYADTRARELRCWPTSTTAGS